MQGPLHNWLITEYAWHPPDNPHHQNLVANLAWLQHHGARIAVERVDGFRASSDVGKYINPNLVSTVVWGSPCTDVSGQDGYALVPREALTESEHAMQQHQSFESDPMKAIIFRHLQNQFPYATVIVTCGKCRPSPLIGEKSRTVVHMSVRAHIPAVGTVQYRPSFASGKPRIYDGEPITALVALPAPLVPHLQEFF
jgi:hypothetical protein